VNLDQIQIIATWMHAHADELQARLVALSLETGGLSAHSDEHNASHDVDDGEAYLALEREIAARFAVVDEDDIEAIGELLTEVV
jgi:hypothetical protein